MATGIIHTRYRLLLRAAWWVEGRFADVEECTLEGGGSYETRPEFLRKYKRTSVRSHTDGVQHVLIFLTAGARTRFAALKTAIQQKRQAGTADQEEIDIDDLPAETTLDASWDTAS